VVSQIRSICMHLSCSRRCCSFQYCVDCFKEEYGSNWRHHRVGGQIFRNRSSRVL
jgi:hypothetical protein